MKNYLSMLISSIQHEINQFQVATGKRVSRINVLDCGFDRGQPVYPGISIGTQSQPSQSRCEHCEREGFATCAGVTTVCTGQEMPNQVGIGARTICVPLIFEYSQYLCGECAKKLRVSPISPTEMRHLTGIVYCENYNCCMYNFKLAVPLKKVECTVVPRTTWDCSKCHRTFSADRTYCEHCHQSKLDSTANRPGRND